MFIGRPKDPKYILESNMFGDIGTEECKAIGHMSGFTYFDYPTAYKDKNIDTGLILPNGGLFPRIYSAIGESGTGKTTTMVQLGGSIVDRCWGAMLVFVDAEGNTTPDRIMTLNRWSESEFRQKCRYIPPSPPISIGDVYDVIRRIAHSKSAKKDKFKVVTPYADVSGKHIEIYPPTVVIVDSIPALVIAQTQEEQVDGKKEFKAIDKMSENMDGMREAKDNTAFLRKVKGVLDEYNIILILINHLSKEVPMGMFDRPKSYHPNLKAGEKLKGGYEQIYQSFGMWRIAKKETIDDRNPIYGDSIRGSVNALDLIKNKSNVSANEFRFVFDKRTGYRPELSDFEYLLAKKFGIEGSPMSMYITILPEIKFTRKNLIDKCLENPILSRAISFVAKYHMGNDVIIMNQFGELDLKRFANMPIEWRMSIILSMTSPYPRYGIKDLGEYAYYNEQALAAVGDMYTGLGDGYVSPTNVDIIKKLVEYSENGYCECEGSHYDSVK